MALLTNAIPEYDFFFITVGCGGGYIQATRAERGYANDKWRARAVRYMVVALTTRSGNEQNVADAKLVPS